MHVQKAVKVSKDLKKEGFELTLILERSPRACE